jgi:hypothetical protein
MNCLVVAATPIEIEPLLKTLPKGLDRSIEIDILISGIGLLATTYSLQKQISIKRPDRLWLSAKIA